MPRTVPFVVRSIAAVGASVLMLGGCGADSAPEAEPKPTAPTSESVTTTASPTDDAPEATMAPERARKQAARCDWKTAKIAGSTANVPKAATGALAAALIGAWQHTHIDAGAGFKPLSTGTDIRFVFPSAGGMLYCQDIKDVLAQQENRATFRLKGKDIVLPAPASGYTVRSWDENTMVWVNKRNKTELYLLQRR